MLSHDTNNPRPYSLNFRVKAHLVFGKRMRALFIEGLSKDEHRWEKEDKYLKSSIILFGSVFKIRPQGLDMEHGLFYLRHSLRP